MFLRDSLRIPEIFLTSFPYKPLETGLAYPKSLCAHGGFQVGFSTYKNKLFKYLLFVLSRTTSLNNSQYLVSRYTFLQSAISCPSPTLTSLLYDSSDLLDSFRCFLKVSINFINCYFTQITVQ